MYSLQMLRYSNPYALAYAQISKNPDVLRDVDTTLEEPQLLLPTAILAVASGGRYIGRAVLGFIEEGDEEWIPSGCDLKTPWLFHVYVEPSERSKGIGKALINACLQHLQTLGYTKACLDTYTARPYYERHWGFQFSHSVVCEIDGKCDILVKDLS